MAEPRTAPAAPASRRLGPILAGLDAANMVTLGGLALALAGAFLALEGRFFAAVACLMYAGLTDLADGLIARKLRRRALPAEMGPQLDSLVDLCAFGFAPAVFAYAFGLRSPLLVLVLVAYVGACAVRLAYFNRGGLVPGAGGPCYVGMPSTYAALTIPVAFASRLWLPAGTVVWVLAAVYAGFAALMVSGLRVPKPGGAWYGFFVGLALVMSALFASRVLAGA